VLFPLLVLIVMTLVQWGLYFHAEQLVTAAAQDGARSAQALGGSTDSGRDAADQLLADALASGLLRDAQVDVVPGAADVTVSVRAEVTSLVPLPLRLEVQGRASGPRESFRDPADRT
jgi:Flp pilus assembly protein TadG